MVSSPTLRQMQNGRGIPNAGFRGADTFTESSRVGAYGIGDDGEGDEESEKRA